MHGRYLRNPAQTFIWHEAVRVWGTLLSPTRKRLELFVVVLEHQSGEDPDNYREEHTKQDECLLSIFFGKGLNIEEKLGDDRCAFGCRKSTLRNKV